VYKIFFTSKSEKELYRLASTDIKRILEILPKLTSIPFTQNLDIKKLTNIEGFYRLGLGKLRILFEIDKKKSEIWIRKVGYRGGVYRRHI